MSGGLLLVFILSLSTGRDAIAALSGFTDLSSLRRDAALINGFTVRYERVTIFPGIVFTCPGRITNFKFVALPGTGENPSEDPQLEVWRTVNDEMKYKRVSAVSVARSQVTQFSDVIYSVSPTNMTFEAGDSIGHHQPRSGRSQVGLVVQDGGGYGNIYQTRDNPIGELSFDSVSIDANDQPLFEVTTDPPGCVRGSLTLDTLKNFVRVQTLRFSLESRPREHHLIPDINFICDTNISQWSVAGQLSSGSEPPEVHLFERRSQSNNLYDIVQSFTLGGANFQERLNERNVYDLLLLEEVSVSAGQVLGIFQPRLDRSSFVVYYVSNTGPQNYGRTGRNQPSNTLWFSKLGMEYPLVGVRSGNCTNGSPSPSGFIEAEVMKEQALVLASFVEVYSQERVIPGLSITESGQLTSWTFAANNLGASSGRTQYPQLRILRLNSVTDEFDIIYKTDSTVEPMQTGFLNVYEYVEDSPLKVESGDVFGFYQPPEAESQLSFAVLAGAGPPNEISMTTGSVKRQTGSLEQGNDLPLVFIVINDKLLAPTFTTTLSVPPTSVRDSDLTKSTDQPSPSVTSSVTPPAPPSGEQSRGSNPTSAIAGGVVGALLAAVGLVVVMLVVFVLVKRRRMRKMEARKKSHQAMDNPVYSGAQTLQKAFPGEYEVPAKHGTQNGSHQWDQHDESNIYATPDVMLHSELNHIANPGYTAPGEIYYSAPDASLDGNEQPTLDLGIYKIGVYVPTKQQREEASTRQVESIYDLVGEGQQSCGQESALSFFTESKIYWPPASDKDELYEQLASKKYREIPRPLIQTGSNLGAGQFGTVYQGVWQSPDGSRNVAVKTLQKAVPESQVKFLQEAAIMGQFSHPNVVKLRGVVTLGEPVMIVLELLKCGDLRSFLIKQQPDPGAMVVSDMPQMLLHFCVDICSGMQYLSGKAFVHRDLAARNILLTEDKTCKIGDFGLSRDLEDENYYVSKGGQVPVKWTAPEALHFKKYSTASDVWSFGAVLYEIWSLGHKPFEGYKNVEAIKMINSGFRLSPPPGCPKGIYDFMITCWHPDKSSRPSFMQLLQELSQPEADLLLWSEEDLSVHSQASVLGAPLEAAKELYPRLQSTYSRGV